MRLRNLIVVVFGLFNTVVYSQQQNGSRVDKLINVIPPSPDAASLGKYGNIPIGLFTGVPEISIPLYTVSEGDVSIPISLSYHSRGFRVSEIASWVGLGWSLNAGGVITRNVRGMPDESATGYFNRDSRMAPLTIPIGSNLTDQQYISLENLAYNRTDLEPDMFSFNFLGRSGRFFFDHNRVIHMISPEDIKIEVTADLTTWTIKDEIGNNFIFGETTNGPGGIEQTHSTNNQDVDAQDFTSSWYLKNIISATGIQYDFYYTSPGIISQDEMLSETDYYRQIPQVITNACYACQSRNGLTQRTLSRQDIISKKLQRIETPGTTVFFVRSLSEREDLQADYALDAINVFSKVSNSYVKKLHFGYSYFQGNQIYGYTTPWVNGTSTYLNKRLKLLNVEDVTDPGHGAMHKFYYDETLLPPRNSLAQDHWGFYNGADYNQTLLPQTSDLPLGIAYGNRNSNGNVASAAVLTKIEYPTGGNTSFTYEPNQSMVIETITTPMNRTVEMNDQPGGTTQSQTFTIVAGQYVNVLYQVNTFNYPVGNISAQLVITDQNNTEILHRYGDGDLTLPVFFPSGQYTITMISPDVPQSHLHSEVSYQSGPVTQNVNRIVGGVRIKQVSDTDPVASVISVKKYEYPATALLTGPFSNDDYLFNNKTRADFVCPGDGVGSGGTHVELEFQCDYEGRSSGSSYSFGDITGGHIAYQNTKTIFGANGENGYTMSTFNYSPALQYGGFPFAPALVYDSRNGLPLTESMYSSAGVLLKQTSNTYTFTEKYRETSAKVGFLYDDPQSDAYGFGRYHDIITTQHFEIISEKANKTGTSVVDYDMTGANPMTTGTTSYYLNPDYNQVSKIETTDSKGSVIRKEFKYSYDYPGIAPYTDMVTKNMIAPVIEEVSTNVTMGKELSRVKTTYQLFNTGTFIKASGIQSSIGGAALVSELSNVLYDDKGNLLQYQAKDGLMNSIIWGYGKLYPVAKITGLSYNNALSTGQINALVLNGLTNDADIRNSFNILRGLNVAMLKTYSYKPGVGISSETDVRGKVQYYEYDLQGRLSVVRDDNNNVIKTLCYNYAGQISNCSVQTPAVFYNVVASQVFTRNNCGSGYIGSQVTYTVPASRYSSTVSQADADLQAQNDITANGQSYANQNGTCTQIICNSNNCSGPDKKCINGACETGIKVYTSSRVKNNVWTCFYVYRWSDCSQSIQYSEIGSTPCSIGLLCN